ncbi:hypothetical protein K6V92_00440 [Cupriavidus respiraculi]|uniref:hypothetical protein n=1 Tax=Cupriavidus respiraculi TaxID=195930 RepID=UPI001C938D9B|nr:hypothetical protein [Cupriavidus respiraculi]MBY4945092.1 hypothetical protein [Cupriavidus respiraculi]
MKTTLQYVDAVKAKLNLPSDYAIAKALGVTRAAVSSYRNQRTFFDDLTAVRVAEILGLNPMEVIAAANRERAKSEDARRVWSGLFDRFAANFDSLRKQSGMRWSPALA